MPRLNIKHLEVFFAVIETGTTTGAAKRLFVSQPAISEALSTLESRLGYRLFQRLSGRLIPTKEALTLIPEVRELFSKIEFIDKLSASLIYDRGSRLTIACAPTVIDGIMPAVVGSYYRASPWANVELVPIRSLTAKEIIMSNQADIAIVYGPIDDPGLKVEFAFTSGVKCAMKSTHPLSTCTAIQANQLSNERIITFFSDGRFGKIGDIIYNAFEQVGAHLPEPIVLPGSSITAYRIAAELNAVAIIDELSTLHVENANMLVKSLNPAIRLPIQVYTSKVRELSRDGISFLDEFVRHVERLGLAANDS